VFWAACRVALVRPEYNQAKSPLTAMRATAVGFVPTNTSRLFEVPSGTL